MNSQQRKRFYHRFKVEHTAFSQSMQGIAATARGERYASLFFNRLMFVYFLQHKGLLDNDLHYLTNRLRITRERRGSESFYRSCLLRFFYEGLSKPERSPELVGVLGNVPYLHNDLFGAHELERDSAGIHIPDEAFARLFAFFDEYQWHLDEHLLHAENENNVDVLGYIFEQYIHQKQVGAHYTSEDICRYIAVNTIVPFIFDSVEKQCPAAFVPGDSNWRLLSDRPDRYIYEAVSREDHLPGETGREYAARRERYGEIKSGLASGRIMSINDCITHNLDLRPLAQDVIEHCKEQELLQAFYTSLERVTVLDLSCGSGAFLLAALDVLEPLYAACLERMRDMKKTEGLVSSKPSRRYLILKAITSNNLYGVDISREATEVCKLRLFLELLARAGRREDIEELSTVDFNIRTGNVLVGVVNEEGSLASSPGHDTSASTTALSMNVRQDKGSDTPVFTLDGDNRLEEERDRLDGFLAQEYGVDVNDTTALKQWRQSHQPFHWYVEFDKVMQRGGFDVIIGNPPYVEYAEIKRVYQLLPGIYKTSACGNLYAYFAERSIALLNQSGRWGMIVPLSAFATERMHSLQQLVMEHSSCLHLSFLSGDANPSRLFEGVKFRLCIGLAKAGTGVCTYYSTRYVRWFSVERKAVFSSLHYCNSTEAIIKGSLPKIGQEIELAILEKMAGRPPLCKFTGFGDKALYYHNCPVNWIRATTFIPAFRSDRDGTRVSTQVRQLNFQNEQLRDAAACIINSSLFFWRWLIYSDCYHLTDREIGGFPVDLDMLTQRWGDTFTTLGINLMNDYRNNSRERTYVYKTTGTVVYDEFYPKLSKSIIDEIDRVLGRHYGFSGEELDFILNYEIKYRMGQKG
jgi:Eco57I restriction-modification methylase